MEEGTAGKRKGSVEVRGTRENHRENTSKICFVQVLKCHNETYYSIKLKCD